MDGTDLHVLAFKNVNQIETLNPNMVQGLIIFNTDANSFKVQADRTAIKVTIHHISVINKDNKNEIFDQALKYIWLHTHCHSIRLNLYHFKDADGKLKADPETKQLLKSRKFKWKTVKNDMETGLRSEVLEVQNVDEEDQMRRSKA